MPQSAEQRSGVIFGLLAYLMWGFAPMYFKLIQQVPATEILVHRIVWSCALMLIIIVAIKRWHKVVAVLADKQIMLRMLVASMFLCFNWGFFIWAINNDHLLDASLGYYINPLLNVLLGVVFLGERLKKLKGIAVGLATTGVLIQVISFGSFPYISFGLACSFAIYGLIRKQTKVDSLTGLLIESAVMLPLAIIYWSMFADSPTANLTLNNWSLNLMLVGTALVTALPLLCFTAAARRINYSTLGFLQYLGPSIMFFLALLVYQEKVGIDRWVTFGFIWTALVIFTWDSIRTYRYALE